MVKNKPSFKHNLVIYTSKNGIKNRNEMATKYRLVRNGT